MACFSKRFTVAWPVAKTTWFWETCDSQSPLRSERKFSRFLVLRGLQRQRQNCRERETERERNGEVEEAGRDAEDVDVDGIPRTSYEFLRPRLYLLYIQSHPPLGTLTHNYYFLLVIVIRTQFRLCYSITFFDAKFPFISFNNFSSNFLVFVYLGTWNFCEGTTLWGPWLGPKMQVGFWLSTQGEHFLSISLVSYNHLLNESNGFDYFPFLIVYADVCWVSGRSISLP